jgi:FkbM family methyltransferase
MSNFFDKGLHFLGKNKSNVFVLNIGAMDGVLFDEMIGYTNMYNFRGLYVEPIPYLFEKLVNNIGGDNIFENCAISDYDGEISMMTINKDVIDGGLVHNCFYGMSAVYPPKNGLGSEFDRPTVEKYGVMVSVPCSTFEKVLNKHKINNFDVVKIDAEGHDYVIFKQIDLKKYSPSVIRIEWINLNETERNQIIQTFNTHNYIYEITGQDIVGLEKNFYNQIFNSSPINKENKTITLVTGLWNLNRGSLSDGWSRSYDYYIEKFNQLLDVNENLIIFGDSELEEIVFNKRSTYNTLFVKRDLSWFKQNDYFDLIQTIRNNPNWYSQVGWLGESTQAKLEMYNPIVMSKMFLLHDAKLLDVFNSDYLFWIDAGLTNTVHPGYFTSDRVFDKIGNFINKFSFICFPYDAISEIHGFDYKKMNLIVNNKINKVARGGFFGGPKETISEINSIYYNLLTSTLIEGYMGTEE